MEMRKCVKGHYYDVSIHSECPYCNNAQNNGMTMPIAGGVVGGGNGATIPLQSVNASMATSNDDGKTLPLGYQNVAPQPVYSAAPPVSNDDDGRTVAIIHKDMGIDPVVGWLVCIDGKEKGRDYRIHTDNNFIGRSEKMDICIRGDETVSRENHAIVSYDSVDKTYYFSPGDGRSIVRLNDKALFQTAEIKAYDKIMVGKTSLLFIPLCCEKFEWE